MYFEAIVIIGLHVLSLLTYLFNDIFILLTCECVVKDFLLYKILFVEAAHEKRTKDSLCLVCRSYFVRSPFSFRLGVYGSPYYGGN